MTTLIPQFDLKNGGSTPTGAVNRPINKKLSESVSVLDFGADPTGTNDSTTAIQNAINSLGALGGSLYFPTGTYLVSDVTSSGNCLTVTCPIHIYGDGAFYTSIKPASGVAGTVNTIQFSPNISYAEDLTIVERIFIGNPSTGTRQGQYGIYLNTLASGQNLPKFTVRDCVIGQGGAYGIYHNNNATNNVNGGMYCALFTNNEIKGGIYLNNSGDSIVISNNILSGTGTGVYANLVAGASELSILDNNITTNQSSIIVYSGRRVNILRNNCEHSTTGSNSNAVFDINSVGETLIEGTICGNLISSFGSSDANKGINLNAANGTLIQDNVILRGISGSFTGIYVGSSSVNVRIGGNSYDSGVTTQISDAGTGTMGVVKPITLLNSWVAYSSSYDQPTFSKSIDGYVVLSGAIASGTTTGGTTLFTLPTGFTPPYNGRYSCFSENGSSQVLSNVEIDTNGNVLIESGANTLFSLSGITFRTTNGANAVSPE